MTATATETLTFDPSGTAPIPFGRLFVVELRKMVDTRAGRWLVGCTIGLSLLTEAIYLIVVVAKDIAATFGNFVTASAIVCSFLLPVLGIMLVTSEWSQRTAMTTFSLEPRRMRIVWAKLLAGVALTAFVLVFIVAVGAICTLLYGAFQGASDWQFGGWGFTAFVINQTFAMLSGFALACLLLNTPAAIVIYVVYRYVLPGLIALGSVMHWFARLAPWIDFQNAQGQLYDTAIPHLTASEWGHLLVSGFLWLVVPLGIGLWRIRRAEVK